MATPSRTSSALLGRLTDGLSQYKGDRSSAPRAKESKAKMMEEVSRRVSRLPEPALSRPSARGSWEFLVEYNDKGKPARIVANPI